MNKKDTSQRITREEELQISIFNGLNILNSLIKQTYGPNGKNVIFDSNKIKTPELSKDGSFIIKNFLLRNKIKSLVILLIEEAFRPLKSDGVNTFFLISSSIIIKGIRFLALTSDNFSWHKGMQKTIHYILLRLEVYSQPLFNKSDLEKVISRFLPEEKHLASLLSEIYTRQNINAGLDIETNLGGITVLEKEQGMRINYGYHSPYFITDSNKKVIEFSNPYILITNYCLKLDGEDFAEWLEPIIYRKRPLLIISPEIEEDFLSTLILNKLNNILDVAYIKISNNQVISTSNLDDIAIYSNARVIKNDRGWKKINRFELGQAKQVIITNTRTLIICEEEKVTLKVKEYYNQFQSQALLSQSEYESEKLMERQKNFLGLRSKLKLGGATLIEIQELRKRLEASMSSIQNCLDEGIIVGGTMSFLHISEEVENWSRQNLTGVELIGSKIVNLSLQEPVNILLNNHSLTQTNIKRPSVVIEDIKRSKNQEIGYDLTTESLTNMKNSSILDSVSTMRKGLATSFSLAMMLLSIAFIIY